MRPGKASKIRDEWRVLTEEDSRRNKFSFLFGEKENLKNIKTDRGEESYTTKKRKRNMKYIISYDLEYDCAVVRVTRGLQSGSKY